MFGKYSDYILEYLLTCWPLLVFLLQCTFLVAMCMLMIVIFGSRLLWWNGWSKVICGCKKSTAKVASWFFGLSSCTLSYGFIETRNQAVMTMVLRWWRSMYLLQYSWKIVSLNKCISSVISSEDYELATFADRWKKCHWRSARNKMECYLLTQTQNDETNKDRIGSSGFISLISKK